MFAISLTATLVMVSPGSSRTWAGPPTSTFPVYVSALIEDSRSKVSAAVVTVGPMDASAAPATDDGPGALVGLPATEIAGGCARVR